MNRRETDPGEGKVPPHDLAAEAAVLSACMIEPRVIDDVRALVAPDSFYAEAHRRIFEACLALHEVGQPVDVVQVGSWLRARERLAQVGGFEYLTEVLNAVPAISNTDAYARSVRDCAQVRRMIQACQRVVALGYTEAMANPRDYLETSERAIQNVARAHVETKFVPLGEVTETYLKEAFERMERGQLSMGVSTGFPDLDKRILGLRGARLHVLAARPRIGKTSFVLGIANNVATSFEEPKAPGLAPRANHVAFFSLETPRVQLAARALHSEARVNGQHVALNKVSHEGWGRMMDASNRLAKSRIHLCDDAGITVHQLGTMSRRLAADLERRGERLALVVLDYVQLVESVGTNKNSTRQEEVAAVSRALKRLAMDLDVPVIALSQLNRDVEKRGTGGDARPRISDLRESGALEQDADVIIFLHNPPKPKTEAPYRSDDRQIVEAIVAKARDGAAGVTRVAFDKQFTRFDSFQKGEFAGEDGYDDEDDDA